MSAQKAKCEIAIRGRQMDSARKEIPVFSATGLVLVSEHNLLPLRRRRLRLKEESLAYFALHEASKLSEWKMHGIYM